MKQTKNKLADYPGLETWSRRASLRSTYTPAQNFVLSTCQTLKNPDQILSRSWTSLFSNFLRQSDDALTDFLEIREVFISNDEDLLEFISDIGEIAINTGGGDSFQKAISSAADLTGLSALRFISAWVALNIGDLELCIAECDAIDEPEATVLTIMGQAQLELCRPAEAIQTLTTAVQIAPGEILAWFQLAKAYYVLDKIAGAWGALRNCLKLAPLSDEVALFMSIIAIQTNDQIKCVESLQRLQPHLSQHRKNATLIMTALKLAILTNDSEKAEAAINAGDWFDIQSQKEFMSEISGILALLEKKGWLKTASTLLLKISPEDRQLA